MYHYLMIFRSSLSSFIMMNTSVSTRVIKVTTLIFGIPHVCPCCAVYTLHILPPHSPHEHIHTAIVVCNLFCHFFLYFKIIINIFVEGSISVSVSLVFSFSLS